MELMKNPQIKRMTVFLSWLAVAGWMALIYWLSHQTATVSGAMSGKITEYIVTTIDQVLQVTVSPISLHFYVRKSAHFLSYLVLGFLVSYAIATSYKYFSRIHHSNAIYILAILVCLLYASSDELHQLIVPGRSGEITDVMIDGSGAMLGIGCYMVVVWCSNPMKRKKRVKIRRRRRR